MKRDNHFIAPDINDIMLYDGASGAINAVLTTLISHSRDGVMIPIP